MHIKELIHLVPALDLARVPRRHHHQNLAHKAYELERSHRTPEIEKSKIDFKSCSPQSTSSSGSIDFIDQKKKRPSEFYYRNVSSPPLRLFLGSQLLLRDPVLDDSELFPGERAKGGQTALGLIFCLVFGHGGDK